MASFLNRLFGIFEVKEQFGDITAGITDQSKVQGGGLFIIGAILSDTISVEKHVAAKKLRRNLLRVLTEHAGANADRSRSHLLVPCTTAEQPTRKTGPPRP